MFELGRQCDVIEIAEPLLSAGTSYRRKRCLSSPAGLPVPPHRQQGPEPRRSRSWRGFPLASHTVIKPELFEPIVQVLKDFEPAALHPDKHVGNSGLDRDRLVVVRNWRNGK